MRKPVASGLSYVALTVLLGVLASTPVWAGPAEDGNAGMQALAKGDYDLAIRMFSRALKSGGLSRDDREFAYSERGKAYLGKGEYRAAAADLQLAVKMKPDDQDAQHQLEMAQSQSAGSVSRPAGSAQANAARAGNDANAGMTAMTNGDYSRAVQFFTRAIGSGGLSQDDTELAYASRGKAYLQMHDARSAAMDLNKAITLNTNDQDAVTGFVQAMMSLRPRALVSPIDGATCKANSSSTGSFFSGKVLQSWAAYPTLTPLDAFAGAYAYLENNQWHVSAFDLNAGSLSATQAVPGSPKTIDLNLRIEPSGAGSKTTVVETIGALAVVLDPRGKLCTLLASVPNG